MILDFIVGASRTLRKPSGVFDTTAQLSVQLRALPLLPGATQRRRLRGPFSFVFWVIAVFRFGFGVAVVNASPELGAFLEIGDVILNFQHVVEP